ncbi:MAG: hypothetical protein ACRCT8_03355 [Lacipirellulaceae bacterium]
MAPTNLSPPSPDRGRPATRVAARVAMLVLLVATSGCASLPRIDPSGERFLLWPNQQPSAPGFATPPANLPSLPPLAGNQAAPPATGTPTTTNENACPLCPFCNLSGGACCFCGDGQSDVPAVAAAPGAPKERMQLTPSRVLAPVGSEVIVRAGVCADDGYLRTNRRVDWMLEPQGTGQFVTVGEQGEMDMLRLPWQRPAKHDNSYAVGYASPYHTCLDRGTPDSTDDVQVRPGDAWITVTSATEGVSYVTAHAPESDNWDARRGTATIYWIDAQWALPTSVSVQPGQTHTLVTTVTRQSDGAPVAGWLVRYEVLQGATARLGYEAGQAAEVTTDASGRASVAVTPTDDQPGTALIKATVVRPAQSGGMTSPRLEVGSGESTVAWSPMASPLVPPSTGPLNPAPSLPAGPRPPAPFVPAPGERGGPIPPDTRAPRLEINVTRDTTGPVRVGDTIPLTIKVKNTGQSPATGIVVFDRFDPGLTSELDTAARNSIRYEQMPSLAPGQQDLVRLELKAASPGRQCHEVTVTADGADRAFERQCFDVEAPLPPAMPKLRITLDGEARRVKDDLYTFKARVFNNGGATASNVRVDIVNDPQLEPEQATEGHVPIPGGVAITIPSLPTGPEGFPITVQYRCRQATPMARVTVYAKGDGVAEVFETRGVEVLSSTAGADAIAPNPPSGGLGTAPPAAPPLAPPALPSGPLVVAISPTANPLPAGRSGVLNLTITNTGTKPLSAVAFRVVLPNEIRARPIQTSPAMAYRENLNTVQYDGVARLAAGETLRLALPYDAVAAGRASVLLEAISPDAPAGANASTVIQVDPR